MVPMILIVDNYDSFTWNLVHYLHRLGAATRLVRNDALSIGEAMAEDAAGMLLSPGPGRPEQAGISLELVGACAEAGLPLLGVCLGHQAIACHFGGEIGRAPRPMHGKSSSIRHDGNGLFAGLPSPFEAVRYHSLTVRPESLPSCLAVTASAPDGTIQGIAHRTLPIMGVQFHPESIGSRHGWALLANYLAAVSAHRRAGAAAAAPLVA